MNEAKIYEELNLKIELGLPIPFRKDIMLSPPSIKTIAMFGEKQYLTLCSYLPKLCEITEAKPDFAYQLLHKVFKGEKLCEFMDFIGLFFIDRLDLDCIEVFKIWRGGQYLIVPPTSLPWLFHIIHVISGIFNQETNNDDPASELAAHILQKIKDNKKKLAAERGNKGSSQFIRTFIEMLAVGYGFSLKELMEFNLFQLMSFGSRGQEYETYERNLRFSMIPMVDHTNDKKYPHWLEDFKYNINLIDEEPKENISNEIETKPLVVPMNSQSVYDSDDFE